MEPSRAACGENDGLCLGNEQFSGFHVHEQGNSLLDIIVFGRDAGKSAAAKSQSVSVGKLTLSHVKSFQHMLKEAGILFAITLISGLLLGVVNESSFQQNPGSL